MSGEEGNFDVVRLVRGMGAYPWFEMGSGPYSIVSCDWHLSTYFVRSNKPGLSRTNQTKLGEVGSICLILEPCNLLVKIHNVKSLILSVP